MQSIRNSQPFDGAGSLPPTSPARVTQACVATPPMMTVHAPQMPTPQPNFAPVRPNCSRKSHSKGSSAQSAGMSRLSPFSVKDIEKSRYYLERKSRGLRLAILNDRTNMESRPRWRCKSKNVSVAADCCPPPIASTGTSPDVVGPSLSASLADVLPCGFAEPAVHAYCGTYCKVVSALQEFRRIAVAGRTVYVELGEQTD